MRHAKSGRGGRTLKLGQTFCRPGAVKGVAHELQRLIIEVAEANPHARSA